MAEVHLTPRDLEERWAESLRFKVKTLANWRNPRKPRGPAFRRYGSKILYPLSAIEAFEQTGLHWTPASASGRKPALAPAPEPCPAGEPACPSSERAATPETPLVAELVAARDQMRADIAAREETLRRTAARLERHYNRRVDLARARHPGDEPGATAPGAAAADPTAEGALRMDRPKKPSPRVVRAERRRRGH